MFEKMNSCNFDLFDFILFLFLCHCRIRYMQYVLFMIYVQLLALLIHIIIKTF
jgi:hypothetical protein